MKLLFTTTLVIFTLSLFSNQFIAEPEGNQKKIFELGNNQTNYYSFAPIKRRRRIKRRKLKYGMMGFSGGINYLSPTGMSYNSFTTESSPSFEFIYHMNRFFAGASTTTPTIKARKNMAQNESENIIIEKGSKLKYNLILFKAGYAVVFKDNFRLIPYIHYGIGDLDSKQIDIEEEAKDESIYSGLTFGAGIRAQYFIIENKPFVLYNKNISGTFGLYFDAGYNYQPDNYSIPFKSHMGYVSIGLFLGFSVKK